MLVAKMPTPAKRLESFTSNAIIWTEQIAKTSPVKPLLDLGLGLMEHNPPEYVCEAYRDSLSRMDVNQYGPTAGLPEFTETLASVYSKFYKRDLKPEHEISVHTGGSEALLSSIMAFIEQGDEVVLLEPSFPLYELHIKFVGGTPVYVPLHAPDMSSGVVDSNDWTLDMDELSKAFTFRTKMLILNTPHNPLGKVFTEAELRAIGEFCVQRGVIILADEVYEFTNFDDAPIPRIATLSPAIGKITLTVGSVGKAFNATGWRVGWVIGDEQIVPFVKAAHIALCYVPPGPPQVAAVRGFKEADERDFWRTNKREMEGRIDTITRVLDEVGLTYSRPHAAYFLLFSIEKLQIPDSVKFPDDVDGMPWDCKVCWFLIQKFGIVTIPASAFYSSEHAPLAKNMLRLVCCKDKDGLALARERFMQLKPYIKSS